MRDDEAFLRAICDNPDDDLPRLIYADFLDEHGDGERAEFIRVQCELARPVDDSQRFAKLVVRSEQLLLNHRRRWLGPLDEFVGDAFFRRGFVEQVSLSARAFLAHAETIWQTAPVRWLTVQEDAWEEIDKLAASPHLGRLRRLSMRDNHLESYEIGALLKSPHLTRLVELDLSGNRLDAYALRSLAECPSVPGLRRLEIGENAVTSAGLIALADSPFFRALKLLNVEAANVGAAGVEALACQGGLPNLEALDLSRNRIGRRGLRALIHGPGLQRLHRLTLRDVYVARDQRAALIRRFDRNGCDFG
jgi:uncharacterized protein (TIGR02996 family)